MKLNELKNLIAKAIATEERAEEVAAEATKALVKAHKMVSRVREADEKAQLVLRTCAAIAIGDRLGAFSKAPKEMCLEMERQRLREYVSYLDPVNNADDADRFEAIVLGLTRYFGADAVEEILFGEEVL